MTLFVLNLLLAFAWAALHGDFTLSTLASGFGLAYLLLVLLRPLWPESRYVKLMGASLRFMLYFLSTLARAALRVAWDILTPRPYFRPGVVAVPLELESDLEIAVLASLITLTPGSLAIDVSSDRRCLYIHFMYIDDLEQFRHGGGRELEHRLREVLR